MRGPSNAARNTVRRWGSVTDKLRTRVVRRYIKKQEESGYGDEEVLAGGETVRMDMDRRRTEKAHKAWTRRKGLIMIDWIAAVLGAGAWFGAGPGPGPSREIEPPTASQSCQTQQISDGPGWFAPGACDTSPLVTLLLLDFK